MKNSGADDCVVADLINQFDEFNKRNLEKSLTFRVMKRLFESLFEHFNQDLSSDLAKKCASKIILGMDLGVSELDLSEDKLTQIVKGYTEMIYKTVIMLTKVIDEDVTFVIDYIDLNKYSLTLK